MSRRDQVDEREFGRLMEESQELHTDAMVMARVTLPDVTDLAADRRRAGTVADSGTIGEFNEARRTLVRRLGLSLGGLLGAGVVSTVFAQRASAKNGDIDVMQLQTAVSLELLAVGRVDQTRPRD